MSIFFELDKPRQDALTNQWVVRCVQHSPALYLVNGQTSVKILANFIDYTWSLFAFDTERDAMVASLSYYIEHGETYPYALVKIEVTDGSQVMEFI